MPEPAPPSEKSETAAPRGEERRECGHVPFPGSGAYGHWTCQRPRHHLGSHRFNNYTTPRIPKVWRLRSLARYWWAHRRWNWRTRNWPGESKPLTLRYHDVLHEAKYDPIPTDHLEPERA